MSAARSTGDLLHRWADAWHGATHHPFLDAVHAGSLPRDVFAAWLAQDYLFVGDLLSFQARLLARAPRRAQAVLAGGLVGLEAELTWFEALASGRGVALGVARRPTTAAYRALLGRLQRGAYPAAVTALWALEQAYLEAWRGAAPGGGDYRPVVAHWTAPAFAAYVEGLAAEATAALAPGAPPAEDAFLAVVRLEREFWHLGWAAGPPAPARPAAGAAEGRR